VESFTVALEEVLVTLEEEDSLRRLEECTVFYEVDRSFLQSPRKCRTTWQTLLQNGKVTTCDASSRAAKAVGTAHFAIDSAYGNTSTRRFVRRSKQCATAEDPQRCDIEDEAAQCELKSDQ
jgi:hypothetical protein